MRGNVQVKKKDQKKINPPFGYFGAKNNIAIQLCGNLPPHNCWVEAFCGSAALTLRKEKASIEIINDIDNEIVNFFKQLRDNHAELCRLIELTPYAERELEQARIPSEGLTDLERARLFLVQSMMAINGVFGKEKGGFSYSDSYSRSGSDARVNRWNNLPERLSFVVDRIKKVRIENKDARKLLQRYVNRPGTLIYIDPPYFTDRTNGYSIDLTNNKEFHTELLEIANRSKCMIFISGYNNALYNKMLAAKNGWSKKEIRTFTKDAQGKKHARIEVLWMNKYFTKALEKERISLRLSAKEKKQGKINPERIK